MSDLCLLDTSIWVLLLRRHRSGDLVARTTELIQAGYGATNGMVKLEVLVGCRDEADFELAERRLSAVADLPLTAATWRIAAVLGFRLRRKGITDPNYADPAKPLQTTALLTSFQLDTTAATAQRLVSRPVLILPIAFKMQLRNGSGVAFGATLNTLKYKRFNEQGV